MDPTPSPAGDLPARPLLPLGVRRLWRDRETLQLGRAPGRAVVLAGVDEGTRHALSLLDGTRDGDRLARDAAAGGCPPDRTRELLALLDAAGLLEDAAEGVGAVQRLPRPDRDRLAADVASLSLVTGGHPAPALERRAAARVLVVGAGRVGAVLAATLAAAGVGAVDTTDDGTTRPSDVGVGGLQPGDVGRRRAEAARERLRAAAPSVRSDPLPTPDLVVLAPVGVLDETLPGTLLRTGTPHLLAEVREQVGVVGPLVLPGRSSCLHCLDLARTDRDPDWPALAAQLATAVPGPLACDVTLALHVAAAAAMQVLGALDEVALPATVGGTLELVLPDWRWRRRTWLPHPDCGCRAARPRAASG